MIGNSELVARESYSLEERYGAPLPQTYGAGILMIACGTLLSVVAIATAASSLVLLAGIVMGIAGLIIVTGGGCNSTLEDSEIVERVVTMESPNRERLRLSGFNDTPAALLQEGIGDTDSWLNADEGRVLTPEQAELLSDVEQYNEDFERGSPIHRRGFASNNELIGSAYNIIDGQSGGILEDMGGEWAPMIRIRPQSNPGVVVMNRELIGVGDLI